MNVLEKYEPFFTMLGAIASVLAVAITIIGLMPSNNITDPIRLFGSEKLAPKGYSVLPNALDIVPENTNFSLSVGDSALLTRKEIPFTLQRTDGKDMTVIIVDGGSYGLQKGFKAPVSNSGCYLWLFGLDHDKNRYSYRLECS